MSVVSDELFEDIYPLLERFTYTIYQFALTAKTEIILPPFKGSTFRGGFGNAFKKVVCINRKNDCDTCLLKEKCVYAYIFESILPQGSAIMRKYKRIPHPFVIRPSLSKQKYFRPGDKLTFSLILIGKAISYLPYFIYTLEELGKIGIGKGRGNYELSEVHYGDKLIYNSRDKQLKAASTSNPSKQNEVPQNSKLITLNFFTPTRLIYQEDLVLDLEFHILIRTLIRRITTLAYFHCDTDMSQMNFKEIIAQAEKVKVESRNLIWDDWERYSSRQETKMNLGGFKGKITFSGEIAPFLPWIKLGEAVHVGKGTSFGLGGYEMGKIGNLLGEKDG